MAERDNLEYEAALDLILSHAQVSRVESAPLLAALGGFLAGPVFAQADSPRFDNSAVDGYAVRSADLKGATRASPVELALKGTIRAGRTGLEAAVEPGTAVRVLTGAPVPRGADGVAMQEDVQPGNGSVAFASELSRGANIRRQAEEYAAGTELLPAGIRLNSAIIALAAGAGHKTLPVHVPPRVAILTTGDEMVEPGAELVSGQIWESNSWGLAAELQALGIEASRYRVPDDPIRTRAALDAAAVEADVLITSGGVSVGEHDYVKCVCEEMGAVRRFWGMKAKPGQPFYFATLGDKLVFGLPGNPVSALVTYAMLVKPALLKMMGWRGTMPRVRARLLSAISKKPARLEFVRARSEFRGTQLWAESSGRRGSHMLGGLAWADCLIHFPLGCERLEAGDEADITMLDWRGE